MISLLFNTTPCVLRVGESAAVNVLPVNQTEETSGWRDRTPGKEGPTEKNSEGDTGRANLFKARNKLRESKDSSHTTQETVAASLNIIRV